MDLSRLFSNINHDDFYNDTVAGHITPAIDQLFSLHFPHLLELQLQHIRFPAESFVDVLERHDSLEVLTLRVSKINHNKPAPSPKRDDAHPSMAKSRG